MHVCTHTHTCSAGVLKQGPLGIHTRPLLVPEQISEQFVVMKRHAPLSWQGFLGLGQLIQEQPQPSGHRSLEIKSAQAGVN